MPDNKRLYQPHEFAKTIGLTKRALRYYNEQAIRNDKVSCMEKKMGKGNLEKLTTKYETNFIFVLVASFLLITGTYIAGTILTPYAKALGASWLGIGILSGSMYGMRLLFGTPIGKLADNRGVLKVLKYSLMIYPLIALTYYFAGNIYFLIVARVFHGIASAMMIPMGMAYVGEISPAGSEGKYMGIYNFCVVIASGLGTILSTIITSSFGFRATFLLLFLLAMISYIIILFSNEDKDITVKKSNLAEKKSEHNKCAGFISSKMLALVSVNIFLAIIASLIGFFIILQLQVLGFGIRYSGFVIAIFYIVSGMFQISIGKWADRGNKFTMIVVSGLCIAISFLVFAYIRNVIAVCLIMGVIAVGTAIFQTAVSACSVLVGRVYGMGKTMGFLNTANSAGMILSCLILGALPISSKNYSLFFEFSGIACFVLIIIFILLWKVKSVVRD